MEPAQRARRHFYRVIELTEGMAAGPYVALAENVAVRHQDVAEFEHLLEQAIEIDPDARREWRLANLLMQRRARWLLGRIDQLFAEEPAATGAADVFWLDPR